MSGLLLQVNTVINLQKFWSNPTQDYFWFDHQLCSECTAILPLIHHVRSKCSFPKKIESIDCCSLQLQVVLQSLTVFTNCRIWGQKERCIAFSFTIEAMIYWKKDRNKSTWLTSFCLLKPWNYFNSWNSFALNMYLDSTGWTKINIRILLLLIFLLQLFIARTSEQTVRHPPVTRSAKALVSMTTWSE